jgi:hypothetical protein
VSKINRKKDFLKATVAIAVALALLAPLSAANANDTTQNTVVRNEIKEYKIIKPAESTRADNILISNTAGDDIIPGITKDAAGNTVVTWTNEQDLTTWNMGIAYSSTPTVQASWLGYLISLTGTTMVYSSDTAYVTGPTGEYQGLYGVNMYWDTLQVGFYQIQDITTDPSTWSFGYWNSVADNPTYATVEDQGYYTEPYYNYYGPVNMYIYHWNSLGYDIDNCPMYLLNDFTNSSSVTFFDAQSHLWTAPAKDPAMAMLPGWFHAAWEYNNATAGKDQIVWKKMDAKVEADIEFTPYQAYVADGTNPEIAAFQAGSSYNVAIVYVNGGDVKCVYSSDDGTTWSSPVTVAAGSYPALCAIGTKLYCAYIDGGNLFLKTSDNGGATWSASEQINNNPGTVSAEENSVDIHSAGIVWVDTRDADKEIYYAALAGANNPPTAPSIDGAVKIKPNVDTEYTVVSTDPDGDDIAYYIDWGDGTNTGWTTTSPSGVEVTQTHKWSKKGTYIIKAKAKDVIGAESDFAQLSITVPRANSVAVSFFMHLLKQYPKAFPILRQLFGL